MSDWVALRNHVSGWDLTDNAFGIERVEEASPRALWIHFSLKSGRPRRVLLSPADEHDDFLLIDSVIGPLTDSNVSQVASEITNRVFAAIGVMAGQLVARRHLPLKNLDTADLLVALKSTAILADELEKKLGPTDRL